jgi:hypothetical protein
VFSVALWFILVNMGAGVACAAMPVVVIDASLSARPVMLQSLGGGGVGFFDEQRKYTSLPLDEVLQVRVIGRRDAAAPGGAAASMIELTDGQRLPGQWAGAAADGQSIAWDSPRLGRVLLGLDRVKSITWKSGGTAAPAGDAAADAGDRLWMVNGDMIAGFISAVHDGAVEIKPTGQGAAVRLPLDRLRAARFANPPVRAAGQSLIQLADGSRLLVTKLTIADDQIKAAFALRATDAMAEAPVIALGEAMRIDLASGEGTLVELASLTPEIVSGGVVFGVAMPPHAEGGGVVIHAPVVVKYALPKGAKRFAAEASGDAGGAESAWVDFDVAAAVDGKPTGRWHFDAAHPRAALNFPLDGGTLTFELTTGVNGPVLDRLRLTDAVLLVQGP